MKTLRIVYLLLGLAGCISQAAWGQGAAAACGNGRYAADVFPAVSQTVGITYGTNSVRDYSAGTDTPTPLLLDFYEPTGDAAAQRPLLIFAFGGSFISGQRQDMDDLCRAFALKGYATATIDYRLVPAGTNGANYALVFNSPARLADQIVRASSDMKAAVRFFRANATTYRIDPAQIIVAGYSAGAITALQTAYIDSETEDPTFTTAYQNNGGLEGNTDLPPPNNLLPTYNARNLAGAFSLAGGVATLSVISAGNPPLFSAHGDADTVVPYTYGPVFGASAYNLYGSGSIHPQATSVGIVNQLYTIAGGDHGSSRTAANSPAIIAAAAAFFQSLICGAPLPVGLASFTGQLDAGGACAATLTWRTASEQNSQAFDVQASADGRAFALLGTVASHNSPTGAAYTYRVGLLAGTRYFRLKMRDFDGAFSYSPVVTLRASCPAQALQLAPNPTQGQVQVSGLPAGTVQLLLYNPTGQCVAQLPASAGATLDLASLPPGLYLLQAVGENGMLGGSVRLVKQ